MRAVIITRAGGPEVLEIRNVPVPEPVGEQVRVRVHAAGLNRADLAQRMGGYAAPPGVPADIPGMEFAGEVEALGQLATTWRPGQRVMGIIGGGAQADYLVVHEGMLVEIPPNLDYARAAGVPEVFMTAHDGLFTQAGLQPGERVLIHAVGSGVGTAAIQLAHTAGATVFGTARTPAKLERARALGLDYGLTADGFGGEISTLTSGAGINVILDVVGGPGMAQNFAALAPWGRIVVLATMGGSEASINLGLLMAKRIQLRGSTLRTRTLEEKLAVTRRFAAQVVPLLASGLVVPVIDQVFPLDQIQAAHTAMGANQNFGKLILTLD